MAKIVLSGNEFLQLSESGVDISTSWSSSTSVYHDNKVAVVNLVGGDLVFSGSGFTSFDNHGYATAGVVTGFSIVTEFSRFDWTELSVGAAELEQMFRGGDSPALAEILFGDDDTFILNRGGASVEGAAGDDIIRGRGASDGLSGGAGNDLLRGANGADVLLGGDDADILTGGRGADIFTFTSVTDSMAGGVDLITDLKNVDAIDLTGIDADSTAGGDQAFFRDGVVFDGSAGELIVFYNAEHDRTFIEGDIDGDAVADFILRASGNQTGFANFDY